MRTAIGIDIGGTNIAAARVDEEGNVLKRAALKTGVQPGGDEVLNKLVELIEILRDDSVAGVGVGTPGPVDARHGIVKQVVNIPGWEERPVAHLVEQRTGLPARLGNDANVAALAEYWRGAGRGRSVVIMLTLGTGIGGGIVIEGKMYDGAAGWAAELGHMCIAFNGRKCACGKTGCIEAYASANATYKRYLERLGDREETLVLKMAQGNRDAINAKMVCDAAREGEELARDVLDETAFYLGVFSGNLINGLNPDVIIIGGGMAGAGDILFHRIREVAGKECLRDPFNSVAIVPAELGNDAGILGAAAMVLLE